MTPDHTYRKKRTCGFCPYIQEIGSTDTGLCSLTGKLHDINDMACVAFPEPMNIEDM